MNDGRCDPVGRFWAGTIAWDHTKNAGGLYRLEELGGALQATRVLGDLTISNGLDWSPDGSLLYYIDSDTQRVDVFDFAPESGEIRNRRPFTVIAASEGLPDGLAIDSEGCVWVALFGSSTVRRYTPAGLIDLEVVLPVSLVTSMAFGGADFGDLYLTTARHRLTSQEQARQVHAGSLFVCRPGPKGLPARRFRWI
jgi:sugar lactone lactonase YvrE